VLHWNITSSCIRSANMGRRKKLASRRTARISCSINLRSKIALFWGLNGSITTIGNGRSHGRSSEWNPINLSTTTIGGKGFGKDLSPNNTIGIRNIGINCQYGTKDGNSTNGKSLSLEEVPNDIGGI